MKTWYENTEQRTYTIEASDGAYRREESCSEKQEGLSNQVRLRSNPLNYYIRAIYVAFCFLCGLFTLAEILITNELPTLRSNQRINKRAMKESMDTEDDPFKRVESFLGKNHSQ